MPNKPIPEESDYLSPAEMQKWLQQEAADSAKAHALRVKDASDIVTAYVAGELTAAEAKKRFLDHNERWGEALPGTHAFPGSTDQAILKSIDAARAMQSFRSRVSGSKDSPHRNDL